MVTELVKKTPKLALGRFLRYIKVLKPVKFSFLIPTLCSRYFHKNQQLILVHFLPLFFLFSIKKPGFRKY